jgi:predicted ATP-dependent serine protease
MLTVLDGDPGLGKNTLLIDIAARVTSHGMQFYNPI